MYLCVFNSLVDLFFPWREIYCMLIAIACHVAFCKDWCRTKNLPFYVTQPNRIAKVFSDF